MRQQSCNIVCGVHSFMMHLGPLYNQHVLFIYAHFIELGI